MSVATEGKLGDVFVSAPGKLILHGEHAVVHGSTALAASLNLRSFLHLTPASSKVTLSFPDLNIHDSWEITELEKIAQDGFTSGDNNVLVLTAEANQKLKEIAGVQNDTSTHDLAVVTFLYLYLCIWKNSMMEKLAPVDALVASTLPTGAGLGSSAAFSVCLSAGFLVYFKTLRIPNEEGWTKQEKDLINKWSYKGEQVIHGNPSGIDNAVSVLGGTIRYKDKIIQPLDNLPSLNILLINTGVPRSTKVLVAGVKAKYNKYPEIIGPVFKAIDEISKKSESLLSELESLQSNSKIESNELYKSINELIEMNQYCLQIIGVSHPSIEHICDVTRKAGIVSKLTGAGGGGCVFAVLKPEVALNQEHVKSLQVKLKEAGFESWVTHIGGIGASYHTSKEKLLESDILLPESLSS